MTISIRLAGPDDWPVIVDFNCRLAVESEGKTLDRAHVEPGVRAVLADPRKGRYLVAVADSPGGATPPGPPLQRGGDAGDQIVGQLMHTFEWSDWRNGDIWWLQSVYVVPDYRRQGVFRALFDELLRQAEADPNVVGLRLYVEENNARAHRTYENMGLLPGGYFVMERFHRRAVSK